MPSSLDVVGRNRNRRSCGRWALRGEITAQPSAAWRYTRLGCKCWACEECGPKKASRVRNAIIKAAGSRDLRRFLTLTLDPSTCAAAESITHIRECWNKFRTYLKRRHGVSISFITITELQKSGYAHLHVLIDRFIPQAWISQTWQAIGGGRIVFIKQVDIHRVAAYLSKYLTKDFLLAVRARQRRYTTSRDIKLFSEQRGQAWKLLKLSLDSLHRRARGQIVAETWDSDGVLIAFDSWREIGVVSS